MINRVLLALILLTSIAWIGYVSSDILNDNNNYSPNHLFGEQDGQLLIINRPTEIDLFVIEDFSTAPLTELVSSCEEDQYKTGYLSALRSHVLL